MTPISKAEKDAIREKFPRICIVRTMKQKSKRHRYYCEESRAAMEYLRKLREANDSGYYYGEVDNGNRKKA